MARIAKRIVRKDDRGLETGEVWVEAYLPFDPDAFAAFEALVAKEGGVDEALEVDPELAEIALAPIDTHLEAMLGDDVVLLAERFLAESRRMDVMHDNVERATVRFAQSFVNTDEIASPHFFPGAWVTKLVVEPGSLEWDLVDRKILDAVSFAAFVTKIRIAVSKIPA